MLIRGRIRGRRFFYKIKGGDPPPCVLFQHHIVPPLATPVKSDLLLCGMVELVCIPIRSTHHQQEGTNQMEPSSGPGKDMQFDDREKVLRSSIERERTLACSILLVQPKRAGTLEREMRISPLQASSLQLNTIKQVQLNLKVPTNNRNDTESIQTPQHAAEFIRSSLFLPASSDIQTLAWNTQSHRSTEYLVKLPATEQWDWQNDRNQASSGQRIATTLNVHALNGGDQQRYPDECLMDIEQIERTRQRAVVHWLLTVYQADYQLTSAEVTGIKEGFIHAELDGLPLVDTTRQYQQLFQRLKVTNKQFLHAVRLTTIEEELRDLDLTSVSPLHKRLGMVAILPDLTSDDIRWVAPDFTELQAYLMKMGIATQTLKERRDDVLHEEFQPAPPITDVLHWQYPKHAREADALLQERFGVNDFTVARDHYQQFKAHLIEQIGQIFTLGGLDDQFDPEALRVDTELDHSFLLNQVRFVQKVIGVYETAQNGPLSLPERRQADAKRFEARRMASCLEDIADILKRQKEYRSFTDTVVQLHKNLGFDWQSESQKPVSELGKTVLNLQGIDADGNLQKIQLPVRMHFRPEKSAATMIEKMFRNGYPTDLTKDTDFFASSLEVLLPIGDPLLAKVPAPESLNFWRLDETGKLSQAIAAEPPTDHAAMFYFMRSVIAEIKGLLSKEKPDVRIIKYQPTGTIKGRSKGSQAERFTGMGRFVVHAKTTVPTWAHPKGRQFMKEFQLVFPTPDYTATECYTLKEKDERVEEGLTYQLRRIEQLALLFFPTRFYPQMRLLEHAYQQAKARLRTV